MHPLVSKGFLWGAHHVGPKAPAHHQLARCIRILPRGKEELAGPILRQTPPKAPPPKAVMEESKHLREH